MIEIAAADGKPSVDISNLIYQHKTIAVKGAIQTVEKAIAVAGGSAYFRNLGLRCFRDVQAARFHPFQERKQYVFSGRVALGLDPVE